MTDKEINDIIDEWHEGHYGNRKLWNVLGWTMSEYSEWVQFGKIPGNES